MTTDLPVTIVVEGPQGPPGPAGAPGGTDRSMPVSPRGGPATVVAGDMGTALVVSGNRAVRLVLPADLPAGFQCTVLQGGAGRVTVVPAAGATLVAPGGHASRGWNAVCHLVVRSNPGGAALWHLWGDLAPEPGGLPPLPPAHAYATDRDGAVLTDTDGTLLFLETMP